MEKEKLHQILLRAENDFPEEFRNIISCRKSQEHEWFITKQTNVRLVDVVCKNCKTNLATALRFFAGTQDHS